MDRILAYLRYIFRITPSWKDCSKASCWQGSNAATRHMNILSPKFTDGQFRDRVKWAEKRGCNCLQLFLVNKGDGEKSGYTALDAATAETMDRRIRWAAKRGMGIVLWCMADDSNAWAKGFDMEALMKTCKSKGWLKLASTVVVGLECDEYWSASETERHIATIRRYYKGKVGVHATSGKYSFCAAAADIVFAQTNPGKNAAGIKAEVAKALRCGRPVNFFELSRHEDRDLAQAALGAGAYGVGNW